MSKRDRAVIIHSLSRLARWSAPALLSVLAAAPRAQEPEEEPPIDVKIEDDHIVMTVDEAKGMPLKQFIKMAQTLTDKVFTYSETDLTNAPDQTINFLGTKRVHRDNFFAFFQTMLYIKGFATLMRGEQDTEIVEIVFMQGAKRADIQTASRYVAPEEIEEYKNQTGVSILTAVELTHINATSAQNTLRQFFTAAGQVGASFTIGVIGDKSLILQGFGPQVNAAFQLLRLADVPPDVPEISTRVVRLVHGSAEELEPILTQIMTERQRAQQPTTGVAGGDVTVGQQQAVKIIPHASLNALLVSGTTDQIIEAQDLIARLDVPLEAADGDVHVIRLQNVLAEELQQTMRQFITEDQTAQQQQAQGTSTPARQPRRSVIVAHEESNSLLLSGTPTKFAQLRNMIDQLDVRQPQVLIECAVVELSTDSLSRIGVELGLLDVAENADFTRPFGFTNFGLSTFEDTDDNGLPDTRLPDFENPLQGVTGGIISNDDFAIPILVNALAQDTKANILSIPSIVVNNNENATVSTREIRPTQTVNQGQVTTQTAAGQDKDAGITLNISPSISTNSYLRLNIELTVSRFLSPFDPNSVTAGRSSERELVTQVTLPTGHTMILGGVVEDRESRTDSGVPILKDIPLLGLLFRNQSQDKVKTNLYFFLTPHILDEDDFTDLAEQTFRKKLEAESYIGHRRLQMVDRKWRGSQTETLSDPGATIEDLDARGGFYIPIYERPGRRVEERGDATGPELPGTEPGAPGGDTGADRGTREGTDSAPAKAPEGGAAGEKRGAGPSGTGENQNR